MSMNYYNPATADLANSAAQQAYYDALARGSDQNTALAWAKFQWQQKLDEAGQTGMWNGQWNNPQEQWFTGQFGQWYGPGGAPNVGDLTQAAQQQQYSQQQGYGQMYGQYYAPGTGPVAGTQTQAALQQQQANAYQTAGLTGWYTPTQNANVSPSRFNYDADQAAQQIYIDAAGGDRNLAAQRWAADASNAVAQFNKEHPAQAQQTLAGQQQQFMQGLQTEQEARAAQAQQQSQAMGYLNLLSNLRGPADWAKYQQVLGSTPGGMRDLVAAAMGQYVPGGGATTGVAPQAASLQSMMAQVGGYDYSGQGGGQLNTPSVYQGGGTYQPQPSTPTWEQKAWAQQQGAAGAPQTLGQQQNAQGTAAWNMEGNLQGGAPAQWTANTYGGAGTGWNAANATRPGATSSEQLTGGAYRTAMPSSGHGGQIWQGPKSGSAWDQYSQQQQAQNAAAGNFGVAQNMPQTQQAWGTGIGTSPNQQMTSNQYVQATGNGTNMYGGQQQQYNLPAPNQISSQSWNNFTPSQQQMLLGQYEAAGWDKNDVQALYNQSLPKYGTNTSTAGTWRLQ